MTDTAPIGRIPIIAVFALFTLLGAGCERQQEAPTGRSPAAATGADPTAHVPSGEPLVVVARVVDLSFPPPCNGQQTFAVPARYETVRVEAGEFDEQRFFVRTECPERPREEGDAGPLSVGALHRLHLDPTPHRTRRQVQWISVRTDATDR